MTGSTSSDGDAAAGALVAVGDAGVDCSGDRERKVVGIVIFEGVIVVVVESLAGVEVFGSVGSRGYLK